MRVKLDTSMEISNCVWFTVFLCARHEIVTVKLDRSRTAGNCVWLTVLSCVRLGNFEWECCLIKHHMSRNVDSSCLRVKASGLCILWHNQ